MPDAPKDDETKFNETLKRMLDTKPTPHKPKDKADGIDPARNRQDQNGAPVGKRKPR
jgi:hypothetical protein